MSTLNSFNRIAPVYDFLAGLVFGKAIKDAQRVHLEALSQAGEIAILGGGTGWFLKDLLTRNPSATVTYLEASERMIAMTLKRMSGEDRHRVVFIHGTEEMLPDEKRFDAVVINFFVDMYPSTRLITILRRLHRALRPGGLLLCTDFVDDVWWQRVMLKVMYAFFKLTSGLANDQLAPWRSLIPATSFEILRSENLWNGFIYSVLFKKVSGENVQQTDA